MLTEFYCGDAAHCIAWCFGVWQSHCRQKIPSAVAAMRITHGWEHKTVGCPDCKPNVHTTPYRSSVGLSRLQKSGNPGCRCPCSGLRPPSYCPTWLQSKAERQLLTDCWLPPARAATAFARPHDRTLFRPHKNFGIPVELPAAAPISVTPTKRGTANKLTILPPIFESQEGPQDG